MYASPSSGLLSPPKVIGPWVTQLLVEGDQVVYREVVCSGVAVTEATGTLEQGQIRWTDNGEGEPEDPWVGDGSDETTSAEVTGTEMRVGLLETATTDVEGETQKFVGYCKESGEEVVDFFAH